ncbi:alpha/beta fold hydrolase [Streptomyces yatensis]|uniref:AB hydrolase-1 domain-containing protein n=1 Tax=Streptomyces yatensis TaxID=155177 RepID=A0ABN2JL40_9ACTN|nr:alpha/beta hydrolase [Streptomyces yatensis]
MPVLPGPDGSLYFTDSSTGGDAVVFLHPASGSADSWVHQVGEFVSAGFRVVTYDRRGTSRSPAGTLWTASAMWQTCTTYWTASVWTRHTWSPPRAVGRSHWSTASSTQSA